MQTLPAESVGEVDQEDQGIQNSTSEVVEHDQERPLPEIIEELKQWDPKAKAEAEGNEAQHKQSKNISRHKQSQNISLHGTGWLSGCHKSHKPPMPHQRNVPNHTNPL